jgi:3-oxoacyl-(acyl-carrier-protein) synthase
LAKRLYITGMGIVSAIGNSVDENWHALLHDQRGIGTAQFVDSKLTDSFRFGEVPLSNAALRAKLGIPEESTFARTTLLAIHAAQEALNQAGIEGQDLDGIIMGCTVSSMCETLKLYENAQGIDNGSMLYDRYDIGSVAMELSEWLGDVPMQNTINTACSSSANAIMQGAFHLRSGKAKRLLVGGADALAKYTINGFNSMMLMSAGHCAPFSSTRDGINLGEGAAFLVVETEDTIGDRPVLAELIGYGNANDSYHATSISDEGEGPFQAMQHALNTAQIQPETVDYINAHGTGTENNDVTEFKAITRLFHTPPPYSSTKVFTGHTLGAAGAIEAVFSIRMLKQNTLIGDTTFTQTGEHITQAPVTTSLHTPVNCVMSNSFGFGGNCTSLLFAKPVAS